MDYRAIMEEEARRNGIRVTHHNRVAQWGRSDLEGKRIFIPSPLSFTSFYTGLHEIGHIISDHHAWDGKPEYLWEYEAFNWAVNLCREKQIKFPDKRSVMKDRLLPKRSVNRSDVTVRGSIEM